MLRLSLFSLIVLMLFPLFGQSPEKDYSEAFQLIEVWLEAQKDFQQLPGLSAAVIKDQEALWSGAFGQANLETDRATETTTLYSICSISKLFTAVAVMKLYDQGKIRLDDKVEDLLPWYNLSQQYSSSGPITVRSLLTHSSGLPREANSPYWTGPDFPFPSQEAVRKGLGEQETLYPASTYFQYSNLGLTLLGEIVEEVSGQSYDEFVQENILDPLGLKNTRTSLPEDKYGEQLAIGYSALNRQGERNKVQLFQAEGIKAAAGYSSNVIDLGQFAAWQFRLRESDEAEILLPSTLKNMQNVHWTDPDFSTTWGLGFVVYKGSDGNKWVSHGGSCPGYRSVLQLNLKQEMAYSVMINAGGTNPGLYSRGIHGILGKVKATQKEESDGEEETAPDLSDYVGYYDSQPWGAEFYLGTWEGKLVSMRLPTDSPANSMSFLKHIEGDTFRSVRDDGELGEAVIFERNTDGEVMRLSRHNNYSPKIKR